MNKDLSQFIFVSALLLATGAVSLSGISTAQAPATPVTVDFGTIAAGVIGHRQTHDFTFSEEVSSLTERDFFRFRCPLAVTLALAL